MKHPRMPWPSAPTPCDEHYRARRGLIIHCYPRSPIGQPQMDEEAILAEPLVAAPQEANFYSSLLMYCARPKVSGLGSRFLQVHPLIGIMPVIVVKWIMAFRGNGVQRWQRWSR